VLQALQSIQLSPTGVREEQSTSAVREAIQRAECILSQSPRIAAADLNASYYLADEKLVASPAHSVGQSRPSSPTRRFQNLPVQLEGSDRVLERLRTTTRSVSSSLVSPSVVKVPCHHNNEHISEIATSQPRQRNMDDQPYQTLGRDYPPSSSAGLSA
jgi:hypothetical protein